LADINGLQGGRLDGDNGDGKTTRTTALDAVSRRATEAVRGENRTGKRARRDGRNAVLIAKPHLLMAKTPF